MKKTTLAAILLLVVQLTFSQETISASGGNASGNGSYSYSVGQMVYTTHTGSGSVNQGVQSGFEVFTLSNIELTTVNLTAVIYPNPTTGYVVLAITDANLKDLSFMIYNLQGKLLQHSMLCLSNTEIDMQIMVSGTYVLKVMQNNQELKTFKIIKK